MRNDGVRWQAGTPVLLGMEKKEEREDGNPPSRGKINWVHL